MAQRLAGQRPARSPESFEPVFAARDGSALARGQSVQQALRAAYRLTLVDLDCEVYHRLR